MGDTKIVRTFAAGTTAHFSGKDRLAQSNFRSRTICQPQVRIRVHQPECTFYDEKISQRSSGQSSDAPFVLSLCSLMTCNPRECSSVPLCFSADVCCSIALEAPCYFPSRRVNVKGPREPCSARGKPERLRSCRTECFRRCILTYRVKVYDVRPGLKRTAQFQGLETRIGRTYESVVPSTMHLLSRSPTALIHSQFI